MTKDEYMKKVRAQLRGVPKTLARQIERDIVAALLDLDDRSKQGLDGVATDIVYRMGTPHDLVDSYLEEYEFQPSILQRIVRIGTRLTLAICVVIALVVVVLAGGGYYYFHNKGLPFDANNLQSAMREFDDVPEQRYDLADAQNALFDFKQSQVVIHYHDASEAIVRCKAKAPISVAGNKMAIKQKFCLMIMPKIAIKANIHQSAIYFVDVPAPMALQVNQSSVRFAGDTADLGFRVRANSTHNTLPPAGSGSAAITIAIDADQSAIGIYDGTH